MICHIAIYHIPGACWRLPAAAAGGATGYRTTGLPATGGRRGPRGAWRLVAFASFFFRLSDSTNQNQISSDLRIAAI
jgi:hypothetical protein